MKTATHPAIAQVKDENATVSSTNHELILDHRDSAGIQRHALTLIKRAKWQRQQPSVDKA